MKTKSKWLAGLSLLMLGSVAETACPATVPPNVACVQWNHSTGWTNGNSYATGTTRLYTVWLLKADGSLDRAVAQTAGLDALIHGLPSGRRCFVVAVTVAPVPDGYESTSGTSNSACKTLRFPGPTEGSIEAPTDGSIEQSKKP